MASSTGSFARVCLARVCILALLSAGLAAPARAQQTADRCEGTLCDFYYGNSPPAQQTAPAGPTPLTVPKGGLLSTIFGGGSQQAPAAAGAPAAPARAPMVQVGGGGLLGMARGAPQERCGGSLCDLYYGGPSPQEVREAQQAEAPPAPQQTRTALAPGGPPAPEAEPRASRRRNNGRESGAVEYARAPQEKPGCVAPPGDPWKCFRK